MKKFLLFTLLLVIIISSSLQIVSANDSVVSSIRTKIEERVKADEILLKESKSRKVSNEEYNKKQEEIMIATTIEIALNPEYRFYNIDNSMKYSEENAKKAGEAAVAMILDCYNKDVLSFDEVITKNSLKVTNVYPLVHNALSQHVSTGEKLSYNQMLDYIDGYLVVVYNNDELLSIIPVNGKSFSPIVGININSAKYVEIFEALKKETKTENIIISNLEIYKTKAFLTEDDVYTIPSDFSEEPTKVPYNIYYTALVEQTKDYCIKNPYYNATMLIQTGGDVFTPLDEFYNVAYDINNKNNIILISVISLIIILVVAVALIIVKRKSKKKIK